MIRALASKVFLPFLFVFISASSSASFPPRDASLVVDQNYFETVNKVLDWAIANPSEVESGIDLMAYSFAIATSSGLIQEDSEPFRIAEKLIAFKRAHPHIRVRVYFEGSRDTSTRNRFTASYLSSALPDSPIEVVENGATHAKGLRVGNILIFGSTNLTITSMRFNNESNLLTNDSEIARGFERFFEQSWMIRVDENNPAPEQSFELAPYPASLENGNGIQLIFNSDYRGRLLEMISEAQREISASIYYFNDDKITQALIDAADRGVKVRVLFNTHKSFALHHVEKNKETLLKLRQANKSGNISVYLDQEHYFSHSKFLITDPDLRGKTGEILLGTGDWNRSDVEKHPQVYAHIKNPFLADQLSRHLSQLIAYESSRMIPPRPYHRFWLGWRKPEMSVENFDRAIAERFVAATAIAGQGRGLIAYQPVLPRGSREVLTPSGKEVILPDEVAVVSYQDQESYRATREAPFGREYGPLHGDVFDLSSDGPTRSRSTVPRVFKGLVDMNGSYDFSLPGFDWNKTQGRFRIWLQKEADEALFQRGISTYLTAIYQKARANGAEGYLVQLRDGYLVEYIAQSPKQSRFEGDPLRELDRALDRIRGRYLELHEDSLIVPQHYREVEMDRSGQDAPSAIRAVFDHSVSATAPMAEAARSIKRSYEEMRREQAWIMQSFREGGEAFDDLEERCGTRLFD